MSKEINVILKNNHPCRLGLVIKWMRHLTFYKGVPVTLNETQWERLQKTHKPYFDEVKIDVPVEDKEPQQGIIKQEAKILTEEEAYALNVKSQKDLLKKRGIAFKSKDKEKELVKKILDSNPK